MSSEDDGLREPRRELYDLIRSERPFRQKAREALRVGRRSLDVGNAHLTRIDPETDHWEVLVSTSSDGERFGAGTELDLERTYCRETFASGTQLSLHDAPNQGWDDDPAFETHELHCYQGTTLFVGEEPYGTVCFVDDDSREAFGTGETMFTELIARLLERELERQQHEAELTRQVNLATVLNRVLRHNLRNELTVIRGNTRLLHDRVDDDARTRTTLDHIDSLISLSRKARTLSRVVETDFDYQSTDVTALVEQVVDDARAAHPAAAVAVDAGDGITATVQPSFERAIEELVENAIKHGGERPVVTVSVEATATRFEVRVEDDGPGLSEQETRVLESGSEQPLRHGSGLGLWLAYWIVRSHDGSIDADSSGDGTTMTVRVPRRPTPELSALDGFDEHPRT